jgi:Glycosyltransferase family 87
MPPDLDPNPTSETRNPKSGRQSPFGFRVSDYRVPVLIWGVILAVTCLHGLFRPGDHSTFPCFREGGQHWLEGDPLYQEIGTSCRYSPLFHIFMVPFTVIPIGLGSLLWRLLNTAVFLGGMFCWMRTLLPANLGVMQKSLLFLLPIPLAFGSLFNGQANLLMVGLMLLTLASIQAEQWKRGALWLTLSCMLKAYPLALGLVLMLIYPRRFAVPFLVFIALDLALPFAMHRPEYVAQQYANWGRALHSDDRSDMPFHRAYRDLWLLCRRLQLPLSKMGYHGVQLGTALLVAAATWWISRRRADRRMVLNTAFGYSCCWMILCGPATESCTYVVLGPTLAWAIIEAWRSNSSPWVKGLLLGSCGLFLSCLLASMFPFVALYHSWGPHPFGALLLTAAVVWLAARPGELSAGIEVQSPASPARAA